MRRFLSTCMASAFLLAGSVWAATDFVEGMEDVPLMAGLEAMPADTVTFDTLRGRLVTAYASGAVGIDRIEAFYAATLPQLGWQTLAPGVFRREGEILRLEIEQSARAAVIVRFALSPS